MKCMMENVDLNLSKAYKEHHLFKELDEMMDFYEAVSDRAIYFLPSGTKKFYNTKAIISCLFKVRLIQLKHC